MPKRQWSAGLHVLMPKITSTETRTLVFSYLKTAGGLVRLNKGCCEPSHVAEDQTEGRLDGEERTTTKIKERGCKDEYYASCSHAHFVELPNTAHVHE